LVPVTACCFLAAAVSGSRSLLITCVLVCAAFFIGCAVYPRAIKTLAKLFVVGLLGFGAVTGLSVYRAGKETTTMRAEAANRNEGGFLGVAERALGPIYQAITSITKSDLLGQGLGLGTNGGAALSGVRHSFIVAEDEWSRAVGESGPIIGLSFMGLRVALALWAFVQCLKAARKGNLLPLVLLGAGGPALLLAQFGQPTSMGATVFCMGLVIAALSIPAEDTVFTEKTSSVTAALGSSGIGAQSTIQAASPLTGREVPPTPFNVTRGGRQPLPPEKAPLRQPVPPLPVPEPPPEAPPAANPPAYKPGRFAIHGSAKKSSDE
jgi:hypothetical protein